MATGAGTADQRAKVFTSNFTVIPDDMFTHVTSVSAIQSRFPKVPASDGRHHDYKRYQPGQPKYGNITFEGNEHKDSIKNLKTWVKEVVDGKEIRKDITITLKDQAQDDVRVFHLHDAFPTHFNILDLGADGQNGTVVKWTLEVRVNRIAMA